MTENILTEFDSFFFLGIGGVSMSALARILSLYGKRVAGCDRCESDYTAALKSNGIKVTVGNCADFENFQVVVYTDALPDNNPALIAARRQKKFLLSRGKLLAELSATCNNTVAVAGCHGKTTCTAMLAHIFGCAGERFTSHIGGDDLDFSNAHAAGNEFFITEACEYRKNFLYLKPALAVILNSDADHLDCYGSAENLKKAYLQFSSSAKRTVKLFGDLPEADGVTFGFDDRADYYAKNIRNVNGAFTFKVYERGAELGRVSLSVCGKHNVLNALAATAAARLNDISFDKISLGLSEFRGVKRRFERIGTHNGAVCIADYAHHPNEIKAALKTARLITCGELYVIFQPHTYSRTKNLFKPFVLTLSAVKKLLIYKTFAAREYYDDAGSALTLSNFVKRSLYGDCETDIERFLSDAREGDTVLFLGAGDIYDIAKTLVD
ncbi:MAG: UDP-N-acetylmuramate--L-alanine ligase [Roseburia sp.]|nr:UDP-N-acetylmuramate--L-alanine ligase [Roseburia sp.]